jgi:hypothetical protein
MTAQTTLTDRSVRLVLASLREFGYRDLTETEVRETANGLLDGSVARDRDIIAMFIHGLLRDAGVLKDDEA